MSLSGTATTNAGRSSGASASGSLRNSPDCLHAPHKGALQSFSYKGILIGTVIPLRSHGAFAGFADRGEIQEGVVAVRETLQYTRDFGLGDRVFHIINHIHQRENLDLVDELLRHVGCEKLNFLG